MTDYLEALLDLLSWEDEKEPAAGMWRLEITVEAGVLEMEQEVKDVFAQMMAPVPEFYALPEQELFSGMPEGVEGTKRPEAAENTDEAFHPGPREAAFIHGGQTWSRLWEEDPLTEHAGSARSSFVWSGAGEAPSRSTPEETEEVQDALTEQIRARQRPVLLEQAQALERAAAQAQGLAASSSRGRGGQSSLQGPSGETAGGSPWSRPGTGWTGGEDPARLVDRAFQRDSRRYDRGFSLF